MKQERTEKNNNIDRAKRNIVEKGLHEYTRYEIFPDREKAIRKQMDCRRKGYYFAVVIFRDAGWYLFID